VLEPGAGRGCGKRRIARCCSRVVEPSHAALTSSVTQHNLRALAYRGLPAGLGPWSPSNAATTGTHLVTPHRLRPCTHSRCPAPQALAPAWKAPARGAAPHVRQHLQQPSRTVSGNLNQASTWCLPAASQADRPAVQIALAMLCCALANQASRVRGTPPRTFPWEGESAERGKKRASSTP